MPVFQMLAAGQGQVELARFAVQRGQRARASRRAGFCAGDEPVEIVTGRIEALHLHPCAVRKGGRGHQLTAAHDAAKAFIPRQFPAYGNILCRHAAQSVGGQRLERQPRVQHDRVVRGIPRGNTQREGIARKTRPRSAQDGRKATGGSQRQRDGKQVAARNGHRRYG
jgi:hypothetical protein